VRHHPRAFAPRIQPESALSSTEKSAALWVSIVAIHWRSPWARRRSPGIATPVSSCSSSAATLRPSSSPVAEEPPGSSWTRPNERP